MSDKDNCSEALQKQIAINKALFKCSKIFLEQDFTTASKAIYDIACEAIGSSGGCIALLNEDGQRNEFVFLESGSIPCNIDPRLPKPVQGLLNKVYKNGKTIYDNDFSNNAEGEFMPEGHVPLENALFAPLNIEGRTVGLMGLANKPGGFSDEDAQVATLFGEFIAILLASSKPKESPEHNLEKYKSLVETIPQGIAEIDLTGAITYSNAKYHSILGYSDEDVLGKKIWSFCASKKDKDELKKVFKNISSNRPAPFPVFITSKSKDDKIVDLRADWNYRFSGSGYLLGFISVISDITEQKITEKSLVTALQNAKNEKAKTEAIIEAIGDGVSILSRDFKFLYQNSIHKSTFGDHVGEYCYDVYQCRREEDCTNTPVAQSFKDGKNHISERKFTQGGKTKYFEIITSALKDDNGDIIAGIEVVRDITERKQIEQNFLKARNLESLGALAGGIAHDYNNLLTVVFGNIELAKQSIDPTSPQGAFLEMALGASKQAKSLTKQLLTFSKGGAPVKRTTTINDLIIESSSFALSGSNIRCEYELPDDIWPVDIDISQMNQVIYNLILNAKDAMPNGGNVNISARNLFLSENNSLHLQEGNYVNIQISDNGMGIDPSHLPKIFDPYFTTKGLGAEKGKGLGLALCHSIITKHGGNIAAASTPGLGTSLTICLPASSKMDDTIQSGRRIEDETAKKRILVMEDEESVLLVAIGLLEAKNYEVVGAVNGEEAISFYSKALQQKKPFHAVIIDLTIRGGMGGEETIKQLLKIDPKIKAIVASGYTDNPILSDCRRYGFKAAVTKPYNMESLEKAIETATDRRNQAA